MIRRIFLGALITVLALTIGYASATFKDPIKESGKPVVLTMVTLENCQPGTWVGIVRWLNNKTDYEDVKDGDLMQAGMMVLVLPPGDYAITHYKPRERIRVEHGGVFTSPAKIIEFREVTVAEEAVTFSFGCEE